MVEIIAAQLKGFSLDSKQGYRSWDKFEHKTKTFRINGSKSSVGIVQESITCFGITFCKEMAELGKVTITVYPESEKGSS